jgi:hypothetical protein
MNVKVLRTSIFFAISTAALFGQPGREDTWQANLHQACLVKEPPFKSLNNLFSRHCGGTLRTCSMLPRTRPTVTQEDDKEVSKRQTAESLKREFQN